VSDGSVRMLDTAYPAIEVYWRPPDGDRILFLAGGKPRLVSPADGTIESLTPPAAGLRPFGWTPDGRYLVYHDETLERGTILVDVETGAETDVEVGFGHASNDGTRIAGLDPRDPGRLCVAPIAGGPCTRIGIALQAPEGFHSEALQWSPDDRWLVSQPASGGRPVLVDPDGAVGDQPEWIAGGAESWQRLP
jgi:hypothetical protein